MMGSLKTPIPAKCEVALDSVDVLALLQAELAGRIQQPLYPFGIQPRGRARFADESDEALQSPDTNHPGQPGAVLNQHINEMPEPHQVVIALHGFPVAGEGVLVLVAVPLL